MRLMRGLNLVSSLFLQRTALRSRSSILRWVAPYHYGFDEIPRRISKAERQEKEEREKEREIYNKWEETCKGISEGRKREWTSYDLYYYLDDPPVSSLAYRRPLRPEDLLKPKDVVLFQYERCPLANKVQAFLDYYEIPYLVVHVTPITMKQIKWSHNRELPIFVVDGQPTLDSSDLINKIVKRMHPDYDLNADEEKKWREWVDNYLVDVVSINMYRTFYEALKAFRYVAPEAFEEFADSNKVRYGLPMIPEPDGLPMIPEPDGLPMIPEPDPLTLSERLERSATLHVGAATMYYKSKKLKKKHNITDERAALYGAAEQWVDALKGRKFLGGCNNPNLADLAVYGALGFFNYLNLDEDVANHTRIGKWYSHMRSAIGRPYCSESLVRAERLEKGEFYDEEFFKK